MGTPLLARKCLLQLFELLLSTSVVPGIVDERPIRARCKVRDAKIYAHILIGHWQLISFDFTDKRDIPVVTLTLDCAGLDFAFDWPMHLDVDRSKLREMKLS